MNNYVIGVGLKGQNVVMKEFNAIKKAGVKLSKGKINVNVGAKVSGAGSGTSKSTGAARTEAKQLAKIQGKAFAEYATHAKTGGLRARDVLGQAMTGGASGLASMLPGVGALFSASQSAVGSAAQDYVAGITSSKNIQLITANFQRAFGSAMDGAFKNSMFAGRQNQAVYANLAEQGVKTSTLADRGNVDLLDKFARAQGVGSLEELFQRMQSGQLKEGGGLGKGEIEFLKSASQMLNNRYSADIGMQTILQTIKGRKGEIEKVAGTSGMRDLAGAVRTAGGIEETEQNYQVKAANMLGAKGYKAMQSTRLADLKIRARTVGTAAKFEKFKSDAAGEFVDTVDDIKDFFSGKSKEVIERRTKKYKDYYMGADAPASEGGVPPSDAGASAPGPMSSANSDLTRAGAALANTLNQINTQLMAVQYQMRTRGA